MTSTVLQRTAAGRRWPSLRRLDLRPGALVGLRVLLAQALRARGQHRMMRCRLLRRRSRLAGGSLVFPRRQALAHLAGARSRRGAAGRGARGQPRAFSRAGRGRAVAVVALRVLAQCLRRGRGPSPPGVRRRKRSRWPGRRRCAASCRRRTTAVLADLEQVNWVGQPGAAGEPLAVEQDDGAASSRSQPRLANSDERLVDRLPEAPTSWASSSWVRSCVPARRRPRPRRTCPTGRAVPWPPGRDVAEDEVRHRLVGPAQPLRQRAQAADCDTGAVEQHRPQVVVVRATRGCSR